MKRLWPLLCLATLSGCGGGFKDKIVGNWKVDPASVRSSRLAAGADKKPDWTDATEAISRVQVHFLSDPQTVEVSGFGQKSSAPWTLRGSAIEVRSQGPTWPVMTFEPSGPRIHLTMERDGDRLQMDLVKNP